MKLLCGVDEYQKESCALKHLLSLGTDKELSTHRATIKETINSFHEWAVKCSSPKADQKLKVRSDSGKNFLPVLPASLKTQIIKRP